jgi:hypothetical protein
MSSPHAWGIGVPQSLVFTEAEWQAAMPEVVGGMRSFLRHYRTPVFKDHGDYGEGWGSGSYVRFGRQRGIITNEHVAAVRREGQFLGHQFVDNAHLYRVVGNHVDFPAPLDLAVLPVSAEAWDAGPHGSQAIEMDQVALAHDPVPGELLTFTGFSGEATGFHFDTLHAEGTCYTAREIELPEDARFNNRYHFGLDYRPDRATRLDGGRICLGHRGSAVQLSGTRASSRRR